jgi:ethanolamine-phosphate cytidylyltransferase
VFHAGHVSILQQAHSYGDYVIVGIYNDATANRLLGPSMPILTTNERVLSILGCKYADDVLIDAPYTITREMIASLKISVVLTGNVDPVPEVAVRKEEVDPLAVPRELGIVRNVNPSFSVTGTINSID